MDGKSIIIILIVMIIMSFLFSIFIGRNYSLFRNNYKGYKHLMEKTQRKSCFVKKLLQSEVFWFYISNSIL